MTFWYTYIFPLMMSGIIRKIKIKKHTKKFKIMKGDTPKMSSRTQKSVRNIIFSIGYQFVTLLSNFVIKTILIKNLGIQYTGVSALFTDILTV